MSETLPDGPHDEDRDASGGDPERMSSDSISGSASVTVKDTKAATVPLAVSEKKFSTVDGLSGAKPGENMSRSPDRVAVVVPPPLADNVPANAPPAGCLERTASVSDCDSEATVADVEQTFVEPPDGTLVKPLARPAAADDSVDGGGDVEDGVVAMMTAAQPDEVAAPDSEESAHGTVRTDSPPESDDLADTTMPGTETEGIVYGCSAKGTASSATNSKPTGVGDSSAAANAADDVCVAAVLTSATQVVSRACTVPDVGSPVANETMDGGSAPRDEARPPAGTPTGVGTSSLEEARCVMSNRLAPGTIGTREEPTLVGDDSSNGRSVAAAADATTAAVQTQASVPQQLAQREGGSDDALQGDAEQTPLQRSPVNDAVSESDASECTEHSIHVASESVQATSAREDAVQQADGPAFAAPSSESQLGISSPVDSVFPADSETSILQPGSLKEGLDGDTSAAQAPDQGPVSTAVSDGAATTEALSQPESLLVSSTTLAAAAAAAIVPSMEPIGSVAQDHPDLGLRTPTGWTGSPVSRQPRRVDFVEEAPPALKGPRRRRMHTQDEPPLAEQHSPIATCSLSDGEADSQAGHAASLSHAARLHNKFSFVYVDGLGLVPRVPSKVVTRPAYDSTFGVTASSNQSLSTHSSRSESSHSARASARESPYTDSDPSAQLGESAGHLEAQVRPRELEAVPVEPAAAPDVTQEAGPRSAVETHRNAAHDVDGELPATKRARIERSRAGALALRTAKQHLDSTVAELATARKQVSAAKSAASRWQTRATAQHAQQIDMERTVDRVVEIAERFATYVHAAACEVDGASIMMP